MDPDRTCAGRGVGAVIVVLRYVVVIASMAMAAVIAHDLIWLLGQTPAALILGIPSAFLFARWVVWVRSVVTPPPPQSLPEAISG